MRCPTTCGGWLDFFMKSVARGVMPCYAEVSADACRGRASKGCFGNTCRRAESSIPTRPRGFASTPLVRAVCSNSARTDPCGGRWVTIVPTATLLMKIESVAKPASRGCRLAAEYACPTHSSGRDSPAIWTILLRNRGWTHAMLRTTKEPGSINRPINRTLLSIAPPLSRQSFHACRLRRNARKWLMPVK